MERDSKTQLAANESIFRDVNEGIERGQWPGEEDARARFRCECARMGCNRLVELTPREYEAVRAHSRRFIVLPGHELPQVETVVETRPDYVIVEKRDQAGLRADASDPRG